MNVWLVWVFVYLLFSLLATFVCCSIFAINQKEEAEEIDSSGLSPQSPL